MPGFLLPASRLPSTSCRPTSHRPARLQLPRSSHQPPATSHRPPAPDHRPDICRRPTPGPRSSRCRAFLLFPTAFNRYQSAVVSRYQVYTYLIPLIPIPPILIPRLIPTDTKPLGTRINPHFFGISVVSTGIKAKGLPWYQSGVQVVWPKTACFTCFLSSFPTPPLALKLLTPARFGLAVAHPELAALAINQPLLSHL